MYYINVGGGSAKGTDGGACSRGSIEYIIKIATNGLANQVVVMGGRKVTSGGESDNINGRNTLVAQNIRT